jgi:gliding motility-associated-like protein
MSKLKAIILFLIVFATQVVAQNTVHLCVGTEHDFGVIDNPSSEFIWSAYPSSLVTIDATLTTNNHQVLIDLNNTGVFMLKVEEEDANGCSGYDSILVEIHDLPNPNIFAIGPTSFCEGDSVQLQVDSVYVSNVWNNGDTLIYTFGDSTAYYFVRVTDTNECSNNSDTITVDVYPNPDADFIVDGVCVNMPSMLVSSSTVSQGNIASSIWHFENGDIVNGDSLLYTYPLAGDYFTELFVTTNYACVDSIGKFYTIYNNPIANFEYTPFTISTLQPEMNFITNTSNYRSLLWDFGDLAYSVSSNPVHEFEAAGTYDVWLTVVDSNQCVDSVMHTIIMYYDFVLYMPNSFTPNNDGMNDTFGPKGIRMLEYKSYEFTVFNRWGEKIFTSDNISDHWIGENTQTGNYSWRIIIEDELGKIREKTGEVLLIK